MVLPCHDSAGPSFRHRTGLVPAPHAAVAAVAAVARAGRASGTWLLATWRSTEMMAVGVKPTDITDIPSGYSVIHHL